jgi:hypothetical protein
LTGISYIYVFLRLRHKRNMKRTTARYGQAPGYPPSRYPLYSAASPPAYREPPSPYFDQKGFPGQVHETQTGYFK